MAFWQDMNKVALAGAAVLAGGMIVGGYLLGDGLRRSHLADRSVTVRGLAERDVTADLATWTISYSATGTSLPAVRAEIEANTAALRSFFKEVGFPDNALSPTGAGVNQYMSNDSTPRITINQRMLLRTSDIEKAQRAVANQFDLVRRGVTLQEGSAISYSFTRLNDIKPEMVAEATKDARKAAEQFATDSGTSVGGIKSATQGYFSIDARDGAGGGGYGNADTPFKKVRVVTTVDFYLE